MTHFTVQNLQKVQAEIAEQLSASHRAKDGCQLIAVSKTFDADHIIPVLEAGHRVFGENKVQEAKGKWPGLREKYDGIELHLIGPLQSNKAGDAVALFDMIETVDREKIARALSKEIKKQNKTPKLLIQVSTGKEPQKAGIMPELVANFFNFCQNECDLVISGLMCIPPAGEDPSIHFQMLKKMADDLDLKQVSMGMSADYLHAVENGATVVRVGSGIFGARSYPVA